MIKTGRVIIIMGVSGTGKSTIGAVLAKKLKAKFIDGDDLHPKANILKMASGQSLDDDARIPWLERIRDVIFSVERKGETAVIVCSALKKQYRDMLREGNQHIIFVHLFGTIDLVASRLQKRKGHFMPLTLLESQFNTLEFPTEVENDVKTVSIEGQFYDVVERAYLTVNQYFYERNKAV